MTELRTVAGRALVAALVDDESGMETFDAEIGYDLILAIEAEARAAALAEARAAVMDLARSNPETGKYSTMWDMTYVLAAIDALRESSNPTET